MSDYFYIWRTKRRKYKLIKGQSACGTYRQPIVGLHIRKRYPDVRPGDVFCIQVKHVCGTVPFIVRKAKRVARFKQLKRQPDG